MSKSQRSTALNVVHFPGRKAEEKADPIFAAMARHRKLEKRWYELHHKLDVAEHKATKKHGPRPWSLVRWRTYSAIGGSEIDEARKEFLRQGIRRKMVEGEYQAVKARELTLQREEKAWDRLAGIAVKRREFDQALEASERASIEMAKTKPTTLLGAAAMLSYLQDDRGEGEKDWHAIAMATLVDTLNAWGKAQS